MFPELRDRTLAIRPPGHHSPVRKGYLNCRIARHHAQAMLGQFQVMDYLRPQHACDVRRGRSFASGSDFLGYATAAHNVSAFKDKSAQPGSGEISRSRESVVAS